MSNSTPTVADCDARAMGADELRARWQAGETTYAAAVRLPGTWAAERFARAGLDVVYVDLQHGFVGITDLPGIVQASASLTTILVRVIANEAAGIGKVLETGADGIIVPMVETAEQAAMAVAACRFGPHGTRSLGDLRLSMLPGGITRPVICLVMIETARAVGNLEAILAVDGVDGVFLGPGDLALSLGLDPATRPWPDELAAALRYVATTTRSHRKAVMITGPAEEMVALGSNCVNLGGDSIFIERALVAALAMRV